MAREKTLLPVNPVCIQLSPLSVERKRPPPPVPAKMSPVEFMERDWTNKTVEPVTVQRRYRHSTGELCEMRETRLDSPPVPIGFVRLEVADVRGHDVAHGWCVTGLLSGTVDVACVVDLKEMSRLFVRKDDVKDVETAVEQPVGGWNPPLADGVENACDLGFATLGVCRSGCPERFRALFAPPVELDQIPLPPSP